MVRALARLGLPQARSDGLALGTGLIVLRVALHPRALLAGVAACAVALVAGVARRRVAPPCFVRPAMAAPGGTLAEALIGRALACVALKGARSSRSSRARSQ